MNYQHFVDWFDRRGVRPPALPEGAGLFAVGTLRCVLPYVHAYWKHGEKKASRLVEEGGEGRPVWQSDTWRRRAGGWTRFLRADHMLDWLAAAHGPQEEAAFAEALERALRVWLVPLDQELALRPPLAHRRVEVLRFYESQGVLQCTRRPDWLPDAMREPVAGVDAVHTPENTRAGLTRYLAMGWEIACDGSLQRKEGAGAFGPVTVTNAFRFHNEPRRMMLGASLQSRAVRLEHLVPPGDTSSTLPVEPHGVRLLAQFLALDGWTHEDAIVVSESAAKKLCRYDRFEVRLRIPAVCSRVEPVQTGVVQAGTPLARAFVDLFALGWRRHELQQVSCADGWLEVGLENAVLDEDVTVRDVRRQWLRTPRWRERLVFDVECRRPLRIGDKLGTPHGLKGVVSRILPDVDMATLGEQRAEVVFSPVGISKRGAAGQFREADPGADRPPHSGRVLVMRQPQDARPRCRACGPERGPVRGQRYGEMEFWALMAHGAAKVARELLSRNRSAAGWIEHAEAVAGVSDARKLARHALNQFLSVVGMEIRGGRIGGPALRQRRSGTGLVTVHKHRDAFEIPLPSLGNLGAIIEQLEDSQWFRGNGGLGALPIDPPVTVRLPGTDASNCEFQFHALHVIPPWLRPRLRGQLGNPHHPLTVAYARVIQGLANRVWDKRRRAALPDELARCVGAVLGDRFGAGKFLRREVLGRRLTRSARAVIVPRPDLRIDQIAVPAHVLETIFEGLPGANRRLVLVHRNPTLHRYGLLALRPVPDDSDSSVFGLPLGVLQGMGADFDGDQAAIVALETEAALDEAERLLLPGCKALRVDRFRARTPGFRLCKELSDPDREWAVAEDAHADQEAWCVRHQELVRERIAEVGDGWQAAMQYAEDDNFQMLWRGMDEKTWLKRARGEMEIVCRSVRRKGRLGGVFRRHFYRQAFRDAESFCRAVAAMQAVTERVAQSSLSIKTEGEASGFPADRFFENPAAPECEAWLQELDGTLDWPAIRDALQPSVPKEQMRGMLAWLGHPTVRTLIRQLEHGEVDGAVEDPRLAWFLA